MSEEKKYYAAIDLGATSGRVVLCALGAGNVDMEVVNRFPNRLVQMRGHFYWDLYALFANIVEGLRLIADRGIALTSIGIDTWGVDVAFVGADGNLLGAPYAYRDPHTNGAAAVLFERFSADDLYQITGLQVMDINTIFKLDTLRRNGSSALAAADKILFTPDAIAYLLTGNARTEYTIASTSGLLNARTRQLDPRLLALVGLDADRFGSMIQPGQVVGTLTPEVQQQTGLGAVPVIAVGCHDTASAVAAVPAADGEFAYLSSGTWSLMGIEVNEPIITAESRRRNYTNEGGIGGTIRFLKNICGMWLLERCRAEWGDAADYDTLIAEAKAAEPFRSLINPDAPAFANPAKMTDAIADYCRQTGQPVPAERGQVVRCIFESLALRYAQVLEGLQQMAPFAIKRLHVIGGGSRNALLNQWTANALGIPVVAGPTECTALGNVMVQAGLERQQVAPLIDTVTYVPADAERWQNAYKKFLNITEK